MNSTVAIPLETDLFLDFAEFLKAKGDHRDPVQVVDLAVRYFMDNADWKPELLRPTFSSGFQWKNLFLPDGTKLRMQYKGSYHYAEVRGDDLLYNEQPTSPAALANTIASSSRNAWRDLWIKRPTDSGWRLADDCRKEEGA